MIEVFKTNVTDPMSATRLLTLIRVNHPEYLANFDLHDCDRVLRIVSKTGYIDVNAIISLLRNAGFNAAVLEDHVVL